MDIRLTLEYEGDVDLSFNFHSLSVGVKAVKFSAEVYVSLLDGAEAPPFLTGVSVFLTEELKFAMDFTGACVLIEGLKDVELFLNEHL